MNRGFTLIELIGSITILALIAVIAFPTISEVFKKSNDDVKGYTEKVVIAAANKYVNQHKDEYPKGSSDKIICANTLYDLGYLEDSFYKKYVDELNNDAVIVKSNSNYTFEYDADSSSC